MPYATVARRCSSAKRAAARTASGWSGPSTRPAPGLSGTRRLEHLDARRQLLDGVNECHENRRDIECAKVVDFYAVDGARPRRDTFGKERLNRARVKADRRGGVG